jgi:uncharacterized cysteine cluster protein YcgN (CxxCxxCC family)
VTDQAPFWKRKQLNQMTKSEWESLCDGCGRCCLVKFEEEETGDIHFTRAACRLFDGARCRCTDYANRTKRIADCVALTPDNIAGLTWLPDTCAYKILSKGGDLFWWHPLVSGTMATVRQAGISVAGKTCSEERYSDDELWTLRWRLPKPRARPAASKQRRG